jgi:hypothetical protein
MQSNDDSYKSSNGKCSKGDTSCNWVGKSKNKSQPKKPKDDGGQGNGNGGGGDTGGGTGGGGGHPLLAPAYDSQFDLPPSPFACEWFDCALSAISILASGAIGAFEYVLPEVAGGAFVVDLVVTAVAFGRTVEDYHQGEISVEREWILNGTGVLGAIPIGPFAAFGFAFSVINGMATFSGYPP